MIVSALCIMLFINAIMGLHLYNNSYCFHLKKNHFYGINTTTDPSTCGDKLIENPILADSAIVELVLSCVIAFFSLIIMFSMFKNIDSSGVSKYGVLLTLLNLVCTAFTIFIYVECVQNKPNSGTLDKSDPKNVYCSADNKYEDLGTLYSIVYLFSILMSILILILINVETTGSKKSNNAKNTTKLNSNNNVRLNKNLNSNNSGINNNNFGLNKNTNLQFMNEKKNNNSNNVNLNKPNNNSGNKPNNNTSGNKANNNSGNKANNNTSGNKANNNKANNNKANNNKANNNTSGNKANNNNKANKNKANKNKANNKKN